jgi:hypothetical protein
MKTAAIVALVALAGTGVLAADANEPHDHRGKLKPYEPGTIDHELTDEQQKKLAAGDLVIITIEDEDIGGRGIAVLDIAAPPDVVWSRITGYGNYPEWVGPVKEAEVYRTEGNDTYTRVKISGFLYGYEYFLRNTWHPEQDMLTWVMDYDRRSDFDDCVGAWFVEAHPAKEGWSRAWFSSDLKLRAKIPGFLMDFIKKQGLKDATSWVKEQSEKAAGTHVEKKRQEYDPNGL